MILYLDASALVKRYIAEAGSQDVNTWIGAAQLAATSIITRAEIPAAINRAQRMKFITETECQQALALFRSEWASLQRLMLNEIVVMRADYLTGQHHLRGYDAVHLASAQTWQDALNLPVTLACFDDRLRDAAVKEGLLVLP